MTDPNDFCLLHQTPVTDFITNRLWSRGRPWLGKAYLKPTPSEEGIVGIGKNRFLLNNNHKLSNQAALPKNTDWANESLDNQFDYSIETSNLPSASSTKTDDNSSSSISMFQRYAAYCPIKFSSPILPLLWRGMVDELRVIARLDNGNSSDNAILLGMGYFSWSGGIWNSAPFCLVARKCGGDNGDLIN